MHLREAFANAVAESQRQMQPLIKARQLKQMLDSALAMCVADDVREAAGEIERAEAEPSSCRTASGGRGHDRVPGIAPMTVSVAAVSRAADACNSSLAILSTLLNESNLNGAWGKSKPIQRCLRRALRALLSEPGPVGSGRFVAQQILLEEIRIVEAGMLQSGHASEPFGQRLARALVNSSMPAQMQSVTTLVTVEALNLGSLLPERRTAAAAAAPPPGTQPLVLCPGNTSPVIAPAESEAAGPAGRTGAPPQRRGRKASVKRRGAKAYGAGGVETAHAGPTPSPDRDAAPRARKRHHCLTRGALDDPAESSGSQAHDTALAHIAKPTPSPPRQPTASRLPTPSVGLVGTGTGAAAPPTAHEAPLAGQYKPAAKRRKCSSTRVHSHAPRSADATRWGRPCSPPSTGPLPHLDAAHPPVSQERSPDAHAPQRPTPAGIADASPQPRREVNTATAHDLERQAKPPGKQE